VTNPVVVLDRDGVINEDSDHYIKHPDEWVPIPGSIEAISRLCQGGFRVAVATNQSGIGRGLFSFGELNAMHRRMRELVASHGGQIELIALCPHRPENACECRKPKPGMLMEITSRMGVDPGGVPFVGDSIGDVKAARAAGMLPWLVETGKGRRTIEACGGDLQGIPVFPDLAAAADQLLCTGRAR
jgi:D-glycero-D-manno-heptose 1,7-bisphosphate phosphatase